MRFLVDAQLPPALARWLTERGHDAVHVLDLGLGDMTEDHLLQRITVNPSIFGGKPIIRGRRLAVEHVLGMLAAGDDVDTLLEGYPWLEREDILACLAYAHHPIETKRMESDTWRH